MRRKPRPQPAPPEAPAADPPAVRRRPGLGRVMRAEWNDPDDIRPDARRTPRSVSGFRAYCPLRRMAAIRGSAVTSAHIMAADKLREQADLARLGYSAVREMIFVQMAAGPRSGPSPGQRAQAAAARDLARALARFTAAQCEMLAAIILANQSIKAWTEQLGRRPGARRVDPSVETGRLLAILDILAAHYEADVADELHRGRRLAV